MTAREAVELAVWKRVYEKKCKRGGRRKGEVIRLHGDVKRQKQDRYRRHDVGMVTHIIFEE